MDFISLYLKCPEILLSKWPVGSIETSHNQNEMVFLQAQSLVFSIKMKGAYQLDKGSLFYEDKSVLHSSSKNCSISSSSTLMKLFRKYGRTFKMLVCYRRALGFCHKFCNKIECTRTPSTCEGCQVEYHIVNLLFLLMPTQGESKSRWWCLSLKLI